MKTLADLLTEASGGTVAPTPQTGLMAILSQANRQKAINPIAEEMQFKSWIRALPWFSEFQKQYGEEPDISPQSNYDYRAAWRGGIAPERDQYDSNRYHWPSSLPDGRMLKTPDHPTAWKEHFMRETGQNPDALGLASPEHAEMWKRSRK